MKNVKEVKNAKIISAEVALSKKSNTLEVFVDFKYEGGGVGYIFSANDPEDMFNLSSLFDYVGVNNPEYHELACLVNKEVRLVIEHGRLIAIGHPTEDKFFRTQRDWDASLPLSKI